MTGQSVPDQQPSTPGPSSTSGPVPTGGASFTNPGYRYTGPDGDRSGFNHHGDRNFAHPQYEHQYQHEFNRFHAAQPSVQQPDQQPYPPQPPTTQVATQQPRRGIGYWLIMIMGGIATLILLWGIGNYAAMFINGAINPGQTVGRAEMETPSVEEILPELSAEAQNLADQLDHVHAGIDLDWSRPVSSSLDPGARPDSAPGVFIVDTTMINALGAGTGAVLTADGLAVTNYHVVAQSSEVKVTMGDSGQSYTATVLGRDSSSDIAVLKIHGVDNLPVTSISMQLPEVGAPTASIGNANGQGYLTAVTGTVIGHNRTVLASDDLDNPEANQTELTGLIQVSQDVVPGYSGGPTINADGQMIGITTAATPGTTAEEVEGFALPIERVLAIVAQVLSGEETDTVSIGADGALGVIIGTEGQNAIIQQVLPDSVAGEIGIQVGDILLAIDGEQITSSTQASAIIRSHNAGDSVNVAWRSAADGTEHTAVAVLQEAATN